MLEHINIPILEDTEGGYYEVYKNDAGEIIKKIWHPQNMKFKSKQQLDEETQFVLLPQDDYELMVTDIKPETRNKYQAKPDKDGKIPQEEIVNITLQVVALKDGTPAEDKEGKDASGRKAFFTFRPQAMGYAEGGTMPSKSRSFLSFATGQDIDGELELENYEDLIGKTMYAEIVEYTNQKGAKRNKISRILPPPKRK